MAISQKDKDLVATVGAVVSRSKGKELVAKLEKNQQQLAKINREIEKAVGAQIVKREQLEQQNQDMRQAILEAMEQNDVKKFDGDLITITYKAPSQRNTFDSKKFKEERPKTYAKYVRVSPVKASISIHIKA